MSAPPEQIPYELMMDRVKDLRFENQRQEIEEKTRINPGWCFQPTELGILAELRRTNLAGWQFTRHVLKDCGTNVYDLDRAVDAVANGSGGAQPDAPQLVMLTDCRLDTDVFWAIEDILPRCSMMMIYGRGGSGKTYLGTSVALGMGSGRWFGNNAEQGAVLYCAFERPADAEDRLAALRDRLSYGNCPVALLKLGGKMLDEAVAELIIQRAKELSAHTNLPVRAVEIDTVAAALGGNKEDDEGLGRLRMIGERIHAETGALVIWIHHEGKGDAMGPRGHLSLADACSVWWNVEERENGDRVVHVAKSNRGPAFVPLFAFTLAPFTAGEDVRGKPIQLCELQLTDMDGALASNVRKRFGIQNEQTNGNLGCRQKILLKALRLAAKHPGGVALETLRSAFLLELNTQRAAEQKKTMTPEQGRAAFWQALKSLRDRELVEGGDDALLPVD